MTASSPYAQSADDVSTLAQLLVIDANGATELPLPRVVRSSGIMSVVGTRLYLRALDSDNEPRIFIYNLSTRQLVGEVAQPHCDEQDILAERGC